MRSQQKQKDESIKSKRPRWGRGEVLQLVSNRHPIVASLDEVDRAVRGPEELLYRGSPAPALLISQDHSLSEQRCRLASS